VEIIELQLQLSQRNAIARGFKLRGRDPKRGQLGRRVR
jgi:hypothetical protein